MAVSKGCPGSICCILQLLVTKPAQHCATIGLFLIVSAMFSWCILKGLQAEPTCFFLALHPLVPLRDVILPSQHGTTIPPGLLSVEKQVTKIT